MSDQPRHQRDRAAPGRTADLLVIGGGVIGLAIAWRAARDGAAVTLVERAVPGAGASSVAAGMLAPVGEASWGEGELLRIGLESADLYPGFVAELLEDSGIDPGYRRCGALHVALDRDEAVELRRRHALHSELGVEAEWLDRAACREREPGLAPEAGPGIHAPGDGQVDPRALIRSLVGAGRARGAELLERTEAVELIVEGGAVAGARTGTGEELRAARTVIATGSWAGDPRLAPGLAPPVRPVKGELIRLRAPDPGAGEHLIVTERVYVVPRPSGEVVIGATSEERGFETAVRAGGVLELLREAYRVLPEVAELEFAEARAGLRPATPDNLPIVGESGSEGLLVAGGHHRNGILLAPLTAAVIAALAAGSPAPGSAGAMSPLRFEGAGAGAAR